MRMILTAILVTVITACGKEKAPETPGGDDNKGTLSIQFDNVMGDRNLQLGTGSYTNASGETFKVDMLRYFISNIKVRSVSGVEYVVPQDSSYFLISENDAASQFVKVRVPMGEYNSLTFTLGVDSLRSTMGIDHRTGALDPTGGMEDGMYWEWNSGYIFMKLEGSSDAAPVDPSGNRKFRYHIGGFGGYSAPTINNIKTFTINLATSGNARVREGREPNIHLMADIMKVFNGSTQVSIAARPTVMFSAFSTNIANNYMNMFTHDHTEN